MHRLLEGEVGSGKTVIAYLAAVAAAESGHQTALMAPTELLAEQHERTLTRLAAQHATDPLRIERLSASTPRTHADLVRAELAAGGVDLVVGTHAREPHALVVTARPIPRSLGLSLGGDLGLSVLDELPPGRQPVRTVLF